MLSRPHFSTHLTTIKLLYKYSATTQRLVHRVRFVSRWHANHENSNALGLNTLQHDEATFCRQYFVFFYHLSMTVTQFCGNEQKITRYNL